MLFQTLCITSNWTQSDPIHVDSHRCANLKTHMLTSGDPQGLIRSLKWLCLLPCLRNAFFCGFYSLAGFAVMVEWWLPAAPGLVQDLSNPNFSPNSFNECPSKWILSASIIYASFYDNNYGQENKIILWI